MAHIPFRKYIPATSVYMENRMSAYRDDLLDYFEEKLGRDPIVERGQMMGHPGFKLTHNNKFFLLLYEDGVTIKLPPDRYADVLKREDVTPFMPMGDSKPMSTWVVWSVPEPSDYESAWEILDWAKDYTASEPPNKSRKRKK